MSSRYMYVAAKGLIEVAPLSSPGKDPSSSNAGKNGCCQTTCTVKAMAISRKLMNK